MSCLLQYAVNMENHRMVSVDTFFSMSGTITGILQSCVGKKTSVLHAPHVLVPSWLKGCHSALYSL